MANETTIQIIGDGPRNTILKVQGVLDTSDLASMTLVDPALLCGIDNTGALKALKLRIKRIVLNIEDGLSVYLWWDATTPVRIESYQGRGHMEFNNFGGLTNNAGAGVTGKILISTQGWATGAILSFSMVVELIKQQN
jgi:hypothetical protein